jgi:phosphinothricin acetyltransferase
MSTDDAAPYALRLATEGDVARMCDLANDAAEHGTANFAVEPEPLGLWRDLWSSTEQRYPWIVAEQSAHVVGFAKAGPHRARGAYAWTAEVTVYLDRAHHGRRLGTRLYEALLPTLAAQGFETLLAGITSGHTASERLHANFGFTRCALFRRMGWKFGAWHDVAYWEKHLRDSAAPRPLSPVRDVWPPAN